jgi:hypothetical protein
MIKIKTKNIIFFCNSNQIRRLPGDGELRNVSDV